MAPGQLGQYKITKVLGVGLTAEVYLAWDKKSKKQLAIKRLRELVPDPAMKGKFLEEGEKAARLNHPGIVPILETNFDQDTRPYIVMPYIPGKTLRQKYPRESRLPLEFVLSYTRQLADALAYAHQQHIVHCDVKPENVLVDENGHLFLCDFGTARIIDATLPLKTGNLFGTPTYMAPEQFRGKYDWATDQYALAIMVYEWLCGHPPFSGENQNQLMDYHMLMPVPSLREACAGYREDITEEVEQVILKALAKKPHERFSSVQEFAQTLEQALPALHPVRVQQTGPVPLWRPQGLNIHEQGGLTSFYWYIIAQRLQTSPQFLGGEAASQILDYASFAQIVPDQNYASRDYLHGQHWEIIQKLFQYGSLQLREPEGIMRYISKPLYIGTVLNDLVTYAAMEASRTQYDCRHLIGGIHSVMGDAFRYNCETTPDGKGYQEPAWNGNNWEMLPYTVEVESVYEKTGEVTEEVEDIVDWYPTGWTRSYTVDVMEWVQKLKHVPLPAKPLTEKHAGEMLSALRLTTQDVPDIEHTSPEDLATIVQGKLDSMPEEMYKRLTGNLVNDGSVILYLYNYTPRATETIVAFLHDAYTNHFGIPYFTGRLSSEKGKGDDWIRMFNRDGDPYSFEIFSSGKGNDRYGRVFFKMQTPLSGSETFLPFVKPVPKSKAV